MTTQPLVSVLMPIFNGERYLSEALNNIQNQTYSNLEIILINDGSTDSSAEIINRFVEGEPRAIAVHTKNTGLTSTLNYGLSLARGVWLARNDQDDVATLDKLERQIEMVSCNPSVVLVGSDFSTLTEETGQLRRYHLPTGHNQLVSRLRRVRGFFPHSSALFRLEVVRQIKGYDIDALYNEDWDLWLRLSELGEIGSVAESLVTIRKHPTQMTRNSGSVIPLGEAFVSSVLHYLRTDYSVQISRQSLKHWEVRRRIRETDSYHEFCKIIELQEQVRHKFTGNRTVTENVFQILLLLCSLRKHLKLLKYIVTGTTQPKLIAKVMRSRLLSM